MNRHDGFTLPEFLVVTPILVLLTALLIPSLGDAKQKVQAAACLSNMRQWGLAMELYCDEYRDDMPYEGTSSGIDSGFNLGAWFNTLSPYIHAPALKDLYNSVPPRIPLPEQKSIYICPSAPTISYNPTTAKPYFSYAMNRVLIGLFGRTYKRSIAVEPAKTILFAESENNEFPFTDGFFIGNFGIPSQSEPRHFGGRNFVFVDGHAAWYAMDDYSRNKAESTNADVEWAKPHKVYWYPCGDPGYCNKN